ncbi:MAG: MarR family transcriptional regulator [Proteobacteria bacterium]|nr:MarR family transcriptional regulator [Pseudomonadota bacterium]
MAKQLAKKGLKVVDASAPDDFLRLDVQLCFALYRATNLVTRLYRPMLEPLGITYSQYLAMIALWEEAPQSVGALGKRLNLDSGTLTPLFKRLEKLGLVSRQRDPVDERRVLVDLTDAGRAMRARAAHIPLDVLGQLPLSVEEVVALRGMLENLNAGLSADDDSDVAAVRAG